MMPHQIEFDHFISLLYHFVQEGVSVSINLRAVDVHFLSVRAKTILRPTFLSSNCFALLKFVLFGVH